MPPPQPKEFDVPLQDFVEFKGNQFVLKDVEGVRVVVGRGTSASPRGPIIPLAAAYTAVELHFDEPYPFPDPQYFTYDGLVAHGVPWRKVYSLLYEDVSSAEEVD